MAHVLQVLTRHNLSGTGGHRYRPQRSACEAVTRELEDTMQANEEANHGQT